MVRSCTPSCTSARFTCCQSRSDWLGRIAIAIHFPTKEIVSGPFHSSAKRTDAQASAAIALQENVFQRADTLCFAAHGAVRPLRGAPAEDVEMDPTRRLSHEALEEERRRHRPGEAVWRDVVEIGDLRG